MSPKMSLILSCIDIILFLGFMFSSMKIQETEMLACFNMSGLVQAKMFWSRLVHIYDIVQHGHPPPTSYQLVLTAYHDGR